MRLSKEKAAEVLGLSGSITESEIKTRYRKLSMKYHPDIWPGGQHMMSLINSAYEVLKGFTGTIESETSNLSGYIADALSALHHIDGLEFEVCGTWLWVTGKTVTDKSLELESLVAGLRLHQRKEAYYLAPPGKRKRYSKRDISMDQIRRTYGSYVPGSNKNKESSRVRAIG